MSQPARIVRDLVGRIVPPLPRSTAREYLDAESHDRAELAANLRDIRRVNRLLGGTSAVLRYLPALLGTPAQDQPATILDLATGSADIPLAIGAWAKQHGIPVTIVASDVSEEILDVARPRIRPDQEIVLAKYDAREVPLPDDSFDVVLCSLSLHHFDPDDAVQVLQEMHRLARRGILVNDLRRSWPAYIAAWLAAHLTTLNRLTRHDAPLSVKRAYTPDELKDLLRKAGILDARISTHMWFRMVAVTGAGSGG